ncbi:MAG: tetratricopeptide repeat protein [Chitinophagaceae bacterium]|jgi:TolA-binding protein|nr:tetratricopeptide repeat protein [Chitinophagaceae bacterium]
MEKHSVKIFFAKHITALLIIVLSAFQANSQKIFDFNATCQEAYQNITALKINAGQQLVNAARAQNPNNLIPDFLESYIDFYTLLLNEDPDEYSKKKSNFDDRIAKFSEGDKSSPFYYYTQSVVALQKAGIAGKFNELWRAGWAAKKAFDLMKINAKTFPDFQPNNLVYGTLQSMASVIPDGYKWIAGFMGVKGSLNKGLQLAYNFVNSNDAYAKLFFNEGAFTYCYLLFYIKNAPDEAFQFMRQKQLDLVNNHLFAYMAANLSLNNRQAEKAKSIILNRNNSSEYLVTPVWDYELGLARMRHMELNEAAQSFQQYLAKYKGKSFVKDAYEKLSWCYYLQGNMQAAENARSMVIKKGASEADEDKQALKDAQSGAWPNALVLKARILNDGGYSMEALQILNGKSTNDFSEKEEKLEFTYFLGRIYDDLERTDDAMKAYLTTIKLGENETYYFAARAAYQMGLIFEKKGNKSLAKEYYEKCVSMKNHEYKNSLDQKAKTGIARCEGN